MTTSGKKQDEAQACELLMESGLFDFDFYLKSNPDVVAAGLKPLPHYVQYGAQEWRDPHPLFDTSYYVENNPDVDFSAINPLVHYILKGGAERRDPHPLFETSYFLKQLQFGPIDAIPLRQYLHQSTHCNISPNSLFDTSYYLKQDESICTSGMSPLVHYVLIGSTAGLNPHPLFSSSFYRDQNPDVSEDGVEPLKHYFMRGKAERRLAYNEFLVGAGDAVSKLYPTLCEIEPMLPSIDELKGLRLRKSLAASKAGMVYFQLANTLEKPFRYLVLMGDTKDEHDTQCTLVDSIVRQNGKDSLIVISPDSGAKLSNRQFPSSMDGVRFFGSDWFPQEFTLTERLAVILRVIIQSAPECVYNCNSQVAKVIFQEYKQQLRAFTSWSECESNVIVSHSASAGSSYGENTQSDERRTIPENNSLVEVSTRSELSDDSPFDITFVMNCHAERLLLERTIPAASLLLKSAQESDLKVDWLFVLDRADDVTRSTIEKCAPQDARKLETDFGDSGLARNAAATAARGKYVAFMDGDDLLSSNWLVEAHRYCNALADDNVVLHPYGSIFFGESKMINVYHDSDDSAFSHTALFEDSIWLTNCFAKRSLYLLHPYRAAGCREGFDFEDWQWNCETIAGGIAHKMVPNTFFCYRVKPAVDSKKARAHSCLLGESSFFDFGFKRGVCS